MAALLALALATTAVALMPRFTADAARVDRFADTLAFVNSDGRYMLLSSPSPDARVNRWYFGDPGDVPLMGDWDCDGVDTSGVFRPSTGQVLLRNGSGAGVADYFYYYGNPADRPLAGDFDGDGCDTVSVFRPAEATVYVSDSPGPKVADYSFAFGTSSEQVVSGDFDGDGRETFARYNRATGQVVGAGTNSAITFGDPGDVLVVGDWDNDGDDTIGVYRPSTGYVYLRNSNAPGVAEIEIYVGRSLTPLSVSGIDPSTVNEGTLPQPNAPAPVVVSGGEDVAFLSRPVRDPVVVNGGSNIELSGFSVVGGSVNSPQGIAITLRNVNGAVIRDVDFANVVGGIYIYNSTDVVIENVRGRNVGDGSIGSGRSNFIQFAESRGGAVRNSIFIGGRTEDMISTWHSGGWGPGRELIIENNYLEGYLSDQPDARAWTSSAGTGIIMSDGEGSSNNGHIIVRNNVLVNPGQIGIQHIDGPNLQTYGNIVYGAANPRSNQPYSSWEGSPQATIYNNRHYWLKPNGTPTDGWYHTTVNAYNNTRDPNLNPNTLRKGL